MQPISSSLLLEALNWRYATKKFDRTKKLPTATWAALEQALVLAPSSFGLQPWKFIVVQDAAVRQALSAASWGQTQPLDCSQFVVFAGRKNLDAAQIDRFLDRTIEVRGGNKAALADYRAIMVGSVEKARAGGYLDGWQSRQVYIALGQLLTAAALLRIDACPMEGLDPAEYDKILKLAGTDYTTLCACAIGYRADDDKYATLPKVRYKAAEVVTHI
ncbi:MAG: NAD(P)H-dependent oxidoreductase [Opitutae bacterium]|nr:NAD(P)H-dependent oxidoreductase [Opitutae bacterium]